MTRDYRDEDEAPRARAGGLPTWLVVTLGVLLLFGLICAGLMALLFAATKTAVNEGTSQWTREMLHVLAKTVTQYHSDNQAYPGSLGEIKKLEQQQFSQFVDMRDQASGAAANLVYLAPYSNAEPSDILAHTRRDGPLPILAVRINGQVVEFGSIRELDQALIPQQTRELPDEPFVPPGQAPRPPPAEPTAEPQATSPPAP